ncbi:MAG: type II toxin-antitoxin system RelE/ParE family toxin [Spirochaetaceae bacterium]|nr:type II toxin-antitoxin system RelE/ParE family toxin [Spirochaetaceae bacterium]
MANKYSVEILPRAIEDLDNIYRYYFEESQERTVADKMTNEIEAAILNLEEFPKANPISRDKRLAKKGYRKLIVGNYITLYKIADKTKLVTVARVFHGMMDYSKYV